MNFILLALTLALLCAVQVAVADVIHLTPSDFDSHVNGDENILVEFYAPWCGHCKTLAPEWEIAGKTFGANDPIKIAAFDATTDQTTAGKFGVQGYPTIKFFPKGSKEPIDYEGGRTADAIVEWVNDKVGTNKKIKKAPTSVEVLTTDNFDKIVTGPNSPAAFVEFYAPWCGHCKKLAPDWGKLGAHYEASAEAVKVGKVDCTQHKDVCSKFGVKGYPSLFFFKDGTYYKHQASRSLDALKAFASGGFKDSKETGTLSGGGSAGAGGDGMEAFVQTAKTWINNNNGLAAAAGLILLALVIALLVAMLDCCMGGEDEKAPKEKTSKKSKKSKKEE